MDPQQLGYMGGEMRDDLQKSEVFGRKGEEEENIL